MKRHAIAAVIVNFILLALLYWVVEIHEHKPSQCCISAAEFRSLKKQAAQHDRWFARIAENEQAMVGAINEANVERYRALLNIETRLLVEIFDTRSDAERAQKTADEVLRRVKRWGCQ